MSVNATIELLCDICGDAADVSMYQYQGQPALRAEAKQDGWIRWKVAGVMQDVCPRCKRIGT